MVVLLGLCFSLTFYRISAQFCECLIIGWEHIVRVIVKLFSDI